MQGLESANSSVDCDNLELMNKKRSFATTPGNRNYEANMINAQAFIKSKLDSNPDSQVFNYYNEPMSWNSNHNSGWTPSFNIQQNALTSNTKGRTTDCSSCERCLAYQENFSSLEEKLISSALKEESFFPLTIALKCMGEICP